MQTGGGGLRPSKVGREVWVMLVRVGVAVMVMRRLVVEEAMDRLHPSRVEVRVPPAMVSIRLSSVEVEVDAQHGRLAQGSHGRIHSPRRAPGVEGSALEVGAHGEVPLSLAGGGAAATAAASAIHLRLKLLQAEHHSRGGAEQPASSDRGHGGDHMVRWGDTAQEDDGDWGGGGWG